MTPAVIVTGAAGGIGEAICVRMREDGYVVIGMDLLPARAADIQIQVDLRDQVRLGAVGRELADSYVLKAVIHNAAVQPIAGAGETAYGDWSDVLKVNVIAVDTLVGSTRGCLAANEGSVVVIGSVHGRATTGGVTAYATSKAAVEGWTRSAALDLGPEIRVNAVAPGAIDTAKLREGFSRWGDAAEVRKAILCDRTALRRIGEARDVAGAVSFLVGPDARFVTGAVLVVDGGATGRLGSE